MEHFGGAKRLGPTWALHRRKSLHYWFALSRSLFGLEISVSADTFQTASFFDSRKRSI